MSVDCQPCSLSSRRHRLARWARLHLACALAACAATPSVLSQHLELQTSAGTLIIDHDPRDRAQAQRVEASLQRAISKINAWGVFQTPVHIELLGTHAQLEQRADKPGYRWLKAWARYDEVLVQSPDTWGLTGASDAELDEALTHELTHCLMYQLSAGVTTWRRKQIPVWFKEGMASYTAKQAYRWPSLGELANHLLAHPNADLFNPTESLYRDDSDLVYSAAHHAFTFLIQRYSKDQVRAVMRAMSQGAVFDEAFAQTVGVSASAFLTDFKQQLRHAPGDVTSK